MATILWYDLETFGLHKAWDRIAQFAAVRTNNRFDPVEEPVVAFCRVGMDYLPNPESCLVTGLTPRLVNERGVYEREFARVLHDAMSVPNTCVAGFNNLRFDDEFVRHLFYRNFYDPYEREYANGNTRWDILDLLRMTHDLRPDGIEWVYDEEEKPVFTLERLASANGLIHDNAHDALSDVQATIALARLIHDRKPELFRYFFRLRKKNEVRRRLNLQHPRPVVYTSSVFTRPGSCSSVVFPVGTHPELDNMIIAYDLRYDPSSWLDLTVEEIQERVFSTSGEGEPDRRVRFTGIHLNRCPAVSPLSVLSAARAQELGIDLEACRAHARVLSDRRDLASLVRRVYGGGNFPRYKDPELQLYSGSFFGDEDRATCERVRSADPASLITHPPQFYDPRGPELLRRYLARNHYDLLSDADKSRWKSYCASKLLAPELDDAMEFARYRKRVESLMNRGDTPPAHKAILRDLKEYGDWIEQTVLR
jgi:exodeoxyribonuclease I